MALKILFAKLVAIAASVAMVTADGTPFGCKLREYTFLSPLTRSTINADHPLPVLFLLDTGCYREGINGRALANKQFSMPDMTVDSCQSLCEGERFYGVEYGTECYCGTILGNGAYQVPDSACNVPCGGNLSQTCGGGNLLSLYKNNFTSQRPRYDYQNVGCYAEPAGSRALDRVHQVRLMTVNKCLTLCSYAWFPYAGLEFGNECWCGYTLNAAAQPSNESCSMPCAGNASETCGGSAMLDLYTMTTPSRSSVNLRSVDGLDGDREELAHFLADELF